MSNWTVGLVFGGLFLVALFLWYAIRRQAEKKLFQNKGRYRTIVDNQDELICCFLPDLTIAFVNTAYCRYANRPREELIGESFLSLLPLEDQSRFRLHLASLNQSNPVATIEHSTVTPDGEIRWCQWTDRAILDNNGGIVEFQGIGRDITEHKQVEKDLQKSQQMLHLVLESMPQLVFWKDRNSVYLGCNRQMALAAGLDDPEDIVGKTDYDLPWKKEEADLFRKTDHRVMETGKPELHVEEYRPAYGKRVLLDTNKTPLRDVEGNIIGVMGTHEDITQRKEAENALKASHKQYRKLIETINEWVWEVDKNGVYTYASPKVRDLLGYEPEELIGKTPFDLMPELEIERVSTFFQDIVNQCKPFNNLENINYHKDGYLVVLETSGVPFFDEEGDLLGYRGTDRDISDRKRAETALEESENRYRYLVETIPYGIQECDTSGIITFVNNSYEKIFGYDTGEPLGTTIWDHVPEKSQQEQLRRYLLTVVEEQPEPTPYFVKNLTRDGRIIDVQVDWNYKRDENQELTGFVAVITDITERKQAETSLNETRKLLEAAIENTPAGIVVADAPDGNLHWLNKAGLEILGETLTSFKNTPIGQYTAKWPCFHEDGSPFAPDELPLSRAILNGETSTGVDIVIHRKSGEKRWVSAHAAPIKNDEGEIIAGIVVFPDITERKMLEEAKNRALEVAEEALEKIEAILDSVAEGLVFTDLKNRIILMSASAEDMIGITLENVFLQPIEKIIYDRLLVGQLSDILSGKVENATVNLEIPGENEGLVRTIQAVSSLVNGKKKEKAGVITILHDISRERELDRMKNEFIATAAHELRTPLTPVMGFSEILLNEKKYSPEQQAEFLAIIHEKSLVLERIINDLLDMSRVESGRIIHLVKSHCDIVPLIERTAVQYQKEFPGYRVEVTLPGQPLELFVDEGKFNQVMENILTNAVKFSAEGSRVQVNCELIGNAAQVTVRDEGVGMSSVQLERVFEKFYRADTSDSAVAGLGLGMYIAKNIIEAHDGDIRVDSQPGKGTTVSFTLPCNSQQAS